MEQGAQITHNFGSCQIAMSCPIIREGGLAGPPSLTSNASDCAVATIILSHKIALAPSKKQETYFRQASGISRLAYNWALAEWRRQYRAGEKPNEGKLRKQLNTIKRGQFPFMLDVTKCAPQQAIKNLGISYKNFFADLSKLKAGKIKSKAVRRPDFKRKGVHDSFRADNGPDTFLCSGKRIKLPVIGWIKMREALRFEGRPLSVTISRVADRWFASVQVEIDHTVPESQGTVVGIDLGVKTLATLSDGSSFVGPKALRTNLVKLRRLSRSHSRKVKGSANRRKAQMRLARQHVRIANIRRDALHKLTTDITSRFGIIGIEDLNVKGMVRNRSLARSISDMGFGEFRRQLEYKAALNGCQIVVADKFYPSSKTCSDCKHVLGELRLSEREWSCPSCGIVHDRDMNAAINLENMAASFAASACGAGSAGRDLRIAAKLPAAKQEQTCAHL